MIITEEQLALLIPGNEYVADWCVELERFLPQYGIASIPRIASFISQCAHESGNFKFIAENLNYRWESL